MSRAQDLPPVYITGLKLLLPSVMARTQSSSKNAIIMAAVIPGGESVKLLMASHVALTGFSNFSLLHICLQT